MANIKGNPGNKGGGRKSAIQELEAGKIIKDLFFNDQDKDKIVRKIQTGKYSGFDMVRMKVLTGNDKVICDALRKLVPDLNETDLSGEVIYIPIYGSRSVPGHDSNSEDIQPQ